MYLINYLKSRFDALLEIGPFETKQFLAEHDDVLFSLYLSITLNLETNLKVILVDSTSSNSLRISAELIHTFFKTLFDSFELGLGRIRFFLPDAGYPSGLSGMSCRILPDIRLFIAG